MAGQRRKSKRRSGASSPSTLQSPPPPKRIYEFIVDECVSQRHVPDALSAAGHTVHLLPVVFGTGALDPDWLPLVGERGWVLITKDKNIRKRPIEMRAHMGTN